MADSSTSSTSSASQSALKTRKPSHFRAKIKVQNIQIIVRNLHQNTIKLSVKNLKRKQSNNTQHKFIKIPVYFTFLLRHKMAAKNQTKDLKCATHLLSDKFRNMTEEKKAIVRDLGFGGLMHIPPLRVDHQLLRELANNFKLGENKLKTGYGSFQITPKKIGHALGINATGDLFLEKVEYKKLSDDDKIIYRRFQDYQEKKKKAINGCLFALMIIYFHLSTNKGKNRAERPPKPWIANWTKEQLVERMTAEREEILASPTSSSEIETTDSDTSTSESEAQEDSEDSGRKHPSKKGKKMDSRKRKQRQEESDSDSESESEPSDESEESSPAEKEKKKKKTKTTPKKKKKKVVVEDSPPEEDQYFDGERYEISSDELDELLRENVDKSAAEGENQADLRSTEGRYVSSQTLPAVNLGSDDPSSQGRTEQSSVNQPSQSMLIPTDSNMMVVREQTPSEALVVVPIQVFVPASQTTTETYFEPTPMLRIEGTIETTSEPPKQLQETTPKLPLAPTKIHPAAEDAGALLMMAWTATYVPKTDPGMPSFSLGLTDSSQEGASTQETEREKSPETASMLEQLDNLVQKLASNAAKGKDESPQIQRETGGESSAKFETPGGINQIPDDIKQKCYIWGTRLKEDADGNTNEYEEMCTLIGQGEYILMRMHLASLQAKSDIESQSMALSDHPKGEFISPKTKKEFRVEAYPSFIHFIDRKKLTSHPYIDNICRGEPLAKGENEKKIKASYVKISGQKISYDCAIYVMKWLELIEPENIKKGKCEWDNWPQEEVDHYRVEYASRILFSEMNKQRDWAIRESSAIRLSKPSSVLLSPFCQINSANIETG
ncbi:hypothetical protein Ahy_A01g002469 [Arachis hypogaea]|uniref:Ubiquitin-like protease family profile domain-containing protein n=1 Tax=Arachis hypogaea TaxID=3818 RepID=A0A445EQR1_ARAHY|nr:hypothetical protein Ahy_A01g002469 [Arachis hypogaea]